MATKRRRSDSQLPAGKKRQCGDLRKFFRCEDSLSHKDSSATVTSRLPSYSENVAESDDERRDDARSADHTISR